MTQEEAHFQFFNYLESYNLVYIKLEIFLFLDYKSLHEARRVCKDWDTFIKEEHIQQLVLSNELKTQEENLRTFLETSTTMC